MAIARHRRSCADIRECSTALLFWEITFLYRGSGNTKFPKRKLRPCINVGVPTYLRNRRMSRELCTENCALCICKNHAPRTCRKRKLVAFLITVRVEVSGYKALLISPSIAINARLHGNCCNRALSQVCAFHSLFSMSMSDIAMLCRSMSVLSSVMPVSKDKFE